ncbi:hypothetical protein SAMN05216579_3216 [Pseudomonas granadensis]|nr:hypothetical protein SAMN05216579_3216 [Pseudomonas granadensis]
MTVHDRSHAEHGNDRCQGILMLTEELQQGGVSIKKQPLRLFFIS